MRRYDMNRVLVATAAAALLAGCSGNHEDLHAYIDDVKARKGGRIEPLPDIRPAPTYLYVAGERRSPFAPDSPQRRVSDNPSAVQGPDFDRPREYLEEFPLDTLRMVGTLERNGGRFGLVQTNDGLIHRVSVNNHLGQNFGRVISIDDSQIALIEIVADGLGGYLERPAAIGLSN